jgi:UDP-N-acetylmuramoylalanine--D-glutamate ligase
MINLEKFVETLDGKAVAVCGLGASNLSVIKALVKHDVQVDAWDDNEDRYENARKAGASIKDLSQEDLSPYACLVLAPGVPLTHPEPHPAVLSAQAAGIEIICDIEMLHRAQHGRKTIGITGTNGKSTTTALIGHILKENKIPVKVGGNIG